MSIRDLLIALDNNAARATTCSRRGCGAALLLPGDNLILAQAFNGGPRCSNAIGSCGCVHAEAKLLLRALKSADILAPTTLIASMSPCISCAHIVGMSKLVTRFVYLSEYRDPQGLQILTDYGIPYEHIAAPFKA